MQVSCRNITRLCHGDVDKTTLICCPAHVQENSIGLPSTTTRHLGAPSLFQALYRGHRVPILACTPSLSFSLSLDLSFFVTLARCPCSPYSGAYNPHIYTHTHDDILHDNILHDDIIMYGTIKYDIIHAHRHHHQRQRHGPHGPSYCRHHQRHCRSST